MNTGGATSTGPLVSVVIVSYNGLPLLQQCLASIDAQTCPQTEVIVVDNASTDGTAAWLRRERPAVRLVESPVNSGFAGGNNLGVRAARGEYVCLLNNDTTVEPDWLLRLVERARASGAALLASKVLTDGVPAEHYAMNGTLNYLGYNIMRVFADPARIFYASAASLLFRRGTVGEPFPEEYFLYAEDVHLSMRMRLAGRSVEMVPASVVHHRGSATVRRQVPAFVTYHRERNRLLNTLVFFSPWTILRLLPYLAADAAAKIIRALAEGGTSAGAVLRAYLWVAGHPGWVLDERRRLQAARAGPDRELLRLMSAHVLEGEGIAPRAVNALSRAYARLAGLPFVRHG